MPRISTVCAAVLFASAFGAPAFCAPQTAATDTQAAANPFEDATPMDAQGLSTAQGGTNTTTNVDINGAVAINDLKAVNTGNAISADTITNGTVNIGANAFSGFNGVGNFVMNTGNQNNLQGSLIVNVVTTPTP